MDSALDIQATGRTADWRVLSLVWYWGLIFSVQPWVEVSEYDKTMNLKDADKTRASWSFHVLNIQYLP
jgi:hypothetical protein